jgi:P27 family predicted phage terminase small subunit
MELHQAEGTKSEVGVKRVAGTNRRATQRKPQRTTLLKGRDGLSCPPDLDDDCKAAWAQLREDCAAVLDAADAAMLETAAVALGRFRQARKSISENGLTIEVHKQGRQAEWTEIVDNPAVKREREYAATLHRAMVELGIGPSARSRFSGIGIEGQSATAAFGDLMKATG